MQKESWISGLMDSFNSGRLITARCPQSKVLALSLVRVAVLTLLASCLAETLAQAGTGIECVPPASRPVTDSPIDRRADWRRKRSDFKDEADIIMRRVAELRKRLEEWGSVTVSAPLIMKEAGEFNLGDESIFPNTLQYINLALNSAQGGVSQSTATAFSNQLDFTVTPTFSVNPLTGVKEQRTGTDSSLTPDSVANGTSITLTNMLAPGTTGSTGGQFANPGALLVGPNGQTQLKTGDTAAKTLMPPSSFTLSGSQAAMIGSNAKLSELLIREMADPKQRLFTNPEYAIHFAIVQVSCNPGWRTRENYIADVSATCEYYQSETTTGNSETRRTSSGQLPLKVQTVEDESEPHVVSAPGHTPLVFSVLPLIDAQTLELQNSERRLTELAASLSAAYPTAAANLKGRDLMQFVKQFQKDTQTVTPRTVSNSYSSGPTFGFRMMPSLTALKDPARSGSKPANILQATSFPVLVTVVVSNADVARLKADSVRVSIANRWLINDRPPFKEIWRRIGLPLWREYTSARVNLAMDFGEANTELGMLLKNRSWCDAYHEAAITLERDLHELRGKIIGISNPVFPLPRSVEKRRGETGEGVAPRIQRVIPAEIVKDGKATLFISGLNFFWNEAGVYVKDKAKITPEDLSIHVWLGHIEGTVLLCNGDDQLVVEFDSLSGLTETDSTSLIIKSDKGAAGWGQAIKLKAPVVKTEKPNVQSVVTGKLVALDAAKTVFSMNVVVSGTALNTITDAQITPKTDGVSFVSLASSDATKLVLQFSVPKDFSVTDDMTLELRKDKADKDPLATGKFKK